MDRRPPTTGRGNRTHQGGGLQQPVDDHGIVGLRRHLSHQSPPGVVLGDPPSFGKRASGSRSRQATLGPEACCSPTVVGLAVPSAAGFPGIQVTVGTWWVDPPRKANGPGGGGSCSSSMTGSMLIHPVPLATTSAIWARSRGRRGR